MTALTKEVTKLKGKSDELVKSFDEIKGNVEKLRSNSKLEEMIQNSQQN